MTRVTALVFDLDQTLFDRQDAFDQWLACQKLSQRDRQRLRRLDQNGAGDRERFLATYNSVRGTMLNHQAFVSAWLRFVQPNDLLIRTLTRLQASYQVAILTNGGVWTQSEKIAALSLRQVFNPDRIFISSQIGVAKPDRNAFEYVANAIGAFGSECLYFGDSIQTDIIAARSAGWNACRVRGPRELLQYLNRLCEAPVC